MSKRLRKIRTPKVILAEEHYRASGLDKGWTWDQVLNLCDIVQETEYELFAYYGIGATLVNNYRTSNKIPCHVALHLIFRKMHEAQKRFGTPMQKVLPDLYS